AGPPAWALRFFRWYCNDHLSEAVLGDLLELHTRRCESIGKRRADLMFVLNVFQFLRPFALKKCSSSPVNQIDMFSSYFKIGWRTMSRQKMYTGITIGGFALGLATCLLIFLYMRHELSYDKNYVAGERLYRIYNEYTGPEPGKWTAMPAS